MIYRIDFNPPLAFNRIDELDTTLEVYVNEMTGYDTVKYLDSEIGLVLNSQNELAGLQINNECVKTFNIENDLLNLAGDLVTGLNIEIELYNSDGFTDRVSSDEFLEEYYRNV